MATKLQKRLWQRTLLEAGVADSPVAQWPLARWQGLGVMLAPSLHLTADEIDDDEIRRVEDALAADGKPLAIEIVIDIAADCEPGSVGYALQQAFVGASDDEEAE